MNQFQVSPLKRLVSRAYFYTAVLLSTYVVGEMLPSLSKGEAKSLEIPRAAKAYINVPISEVPEQYR